MKLCDMQFDTKKQIFWINLLSISKNALPKGGFSPPQWSRRRRNRRRRDRRGGEKATFKFLYLNLPTARRVESVSENVFYGFSIT